MNARKEAYGYVVDLLGDHLEHWPSEYKPHIIAELRRIRDAMAAAAALPEPQRAKGEK